MAEFLLIAIPLAMVAGCVVMLLRGRVSSSRRRQRGEGLVRLMDEGRTEEAAAAVRAWEAERPRDAVSQAMIAAAWADLGEHELAIRAVDAVPRANERLAGPLYKLRHASLTALGRQDEAERMLESGDRSGFVTAREIRLKQDLDRAFVDDRQMDEATEILRRDPRAVVAVATRAFGHVQRRAWHEAVADARRLQQLTGSSRVSRLMLGQALMGAGDEPGARHEFDAAVEGPGGARYAKEAGLYAAYPLMTDGRYRAALDEVDRAIAHHADVAVLRRLRAQVLWRVGRGADAHAELRIARDLVPSVVDRELEAILLADEGRADEAKAALEDLPETATFPRAYILCRLGAPGAVEALREHVSAMPWDVDIDLIRALPAPGGGTWGERPDA